MTRRGSTFRATLFFHAAGSFHEVLWRPAVDVYRTQGGWLVKFELPGVRLEDVTLRVGGRRLLLQGVRRDCLREAGCRHQSLEISYGRFERQVELPANLERAPLDTEYTLGMLIVHIRTEEGES